MTFRVALAQMALHPGDLVGNDRKAEDAVKKAAENRADIVLLPELWASGFDLAQTTKYASILGEGWFARMKELAVQYEITLGGSLIEEFQGDYFNTFALYKNNGDLLGSYRKIHLFQMLQENVHFNRGKEIKVFDSPWCSLGMAICYDLRFPELFRSIAVKGAKLILLVAEWPQRRIEHWKILLQARAIENQCFIAAVNKTGTSQGTALGGCSTVVNPMGEFLVLGDEKEKVLVADIDLEEVGKIRKWMPIFDDRSPDVY